MSETQFCRNYACSVHTCTYIHWENTSIYNQSIVVSRSATQFLIEHNYVSQTTEVGNETMIWPGGGLKRNMNLINLDMILFFFFYMNLILTSISSQPIASYPGSLEARLIAAMRCACVSLRATRYVHDSRNMTRWM